MAGEPLRIISVGRCISKKGFQIGIQGLAKARSRRSDIKMLYTIIGDGPEIDTLRALVTEHELGDCVHLLGSQSHPRVAEELARSDVMMAPSITGPDGDMEGIPTVAMEAMASGLPVISTRHSGIPEAVVHGYTGLLAPESDPDCLADHILTLSDNPDLGNRLGTQGRLHVRSNFNIVRQNEKIEGLYRQIAFDV